MKHYLPFIVTAIVILHLALLLTRGSLFAGDVFPYAGCFVQGGLLAALLLMARLSGKLSFNRGRDSILIFWLVSYQAIAVFSTFHNPHDRVTLMMSVLAGLNPIALAYCLPKVITSKHYHIIFATVAGLAVVHSLIEAFLIVTQETSFAGRNIAWDHGRLPPLLSYLRPYTGGLYTNPNTIGSYLMMIPATVLFLYLDTKQNWYKSLLLVSLVLVSLSIALTFSRSAFCIAVASLSLWAVIKLKQKGVPSAAGLLGVGALVSGVFVWLFSFTTLPNLFYLSHREDILTQTKVALAKSSLVGIGMFGQYNQGVTPHDFWSASFTYFGIAGFICLTGWFLCFLRRILRSLWLCREEKLWTVAGALLAFVGIYGIFEYIFTYPLFFTSSLAYVMIGYLSDYSENRRVPTDLSRVESKPKVLSSAR